MLDVYFHKLTSCCLSVCQEDVDPLTDGGGQEEVWNDHVKIRAEVH